MNQLRDLLDEIADEVDPTHLRPDDLWRQGVRRRRRLHGAVAAAVLVVVALVGGLALVDVPGSAGPPVATAPEADGAVPLRLHAVPAHLAGTSDAGAPGQLAAIWRVRDGRSRWLVADGTAWVGVSAADGSYRWLDEVPGEAHALLSPDGRRVLWVEEGDVPGRDTPEARALVVLDAATGALTRRDLLADAPHGLMVDPEMLAWAPGSRHVVLLRCVNEPWDDERGSFCLHGGADAWNVDTGDVLGFDVPAGAELVGRGVSGVLVTQGRRRVSELDVTTGSIYPLGRVSGGQELYLSFVSPLRTGDALVLGQQERPNGMIVPAVGIAALNGSFDATERLGRYTSVSAVGPVPLAPGETGLAFIEYLAPGGSDRTDTRVTVKRYWPGQGVSTVADTGQGFRGDDVQLAADLVAAGRFTDEAPQPAESWGRWALPGIGVAVALGLLAVGLAHRRRRRTAR